MSPTTFRALRRHLTLSQEFIADFLGMTKASVCQFERGARYRPSTERMRPAFDKMLEAWSLWGCRL